VAGSVSAGLDEPALLNAKPARLNGFFNIRSLPKGLRSVVFNPDFRELKTHFRDDWTDLILKEREWRGIQPALTPRGCGKM
jgi:hypothetical protein